MDKKKIILISLIGLVALFVAGIMIWNFSNNDSNYDLKMSGTYYDNASDFEVGAHRETVSELPKAYLEHITYEITEIDEDEMLATLIISVPDITDVLPSFVDQIIADNQDVTYEELLAAAKKGMEEIFNSEDLPKRETTIQLSVGEQENSYKLILNEEWNMAVIGNLENMYVNYLKILIGEITNEMPK